MPFIGVLMACTGLTAAYCSLSAIHEQRRSQAVYDRAHEDFMANPNKVENRVLVFRARLEHHGQSRTFCHPCRRRAIVRRRLERTIGRRLG